MLKKSLMLICVLGLTGLFCVSNCRGATFDNEDFVIEETSFETQSYWILETGVWNFYVKTGGTVYKNAAAGATLPITITSTGFTGFTGTIRDIELYGEIKSAGWVTNKYKPRYGSIKFQVAAADTSETCTDFVGSDGTSDSYFLISGSEIPSSLDIKRYIKYKAYFSTADTTETPILEDITLNYSSATIIEDDSDAFFSIMRPKLVFTTQPPATGTAGDAISPAVVIEIQTAGNVLLTSDNTTKVTLSATGGSAGAALRGTTTVTAAGGVATFSNIIYGVAEAITLTASSAPVCTEATSTAITFSKGTLIRADVEPEARKSGMTEDVTVRFVTDNPILTDSKIVITFPAGFDVSGVGAVGASETIDGALAVSALGQVVTITRDGLGTLQPAGETEVIIITGIVNPVTTGGTTGVYGVKTTTAAGVLIDEDNAVAGDYIFGVLSGPGPLSTPVVAHGSYIMGASENTTISFITVNPVPVGGKIEVDFNDNYDLSGAIAIVSGNPGATVIADDQMLIITTGTQLSSPVSASIVVSGIRNPMVLGTTGTYDIRTKGTDGVLIDEGTADANNILLPTIDIIVPENGEVWSIGTQHNIEWTYDGAISDNLTFSYSIDAGADGYIGSIKTGVANNGPFVWTVPADLTTQGRVKITDMFYQELKDESGTHFGDGDAVATDVVVKGTGNAVSLRLDMTARGVASKNIVDTFNGPRSVYAADIDGDGDMDVLGAAYGGDDIMWWENIDGAGNFTGGGHSIAGGTFDGACSVYAADMDGDGDMDVLGAAALADDIAWWENTDGAGTFVLKQIIAGETIAGAFDGACSVCAADMDGDGDMDVLGAAMGAGQIKWWENTDGVGTFVTGQTISGVNGAFDVSAADLDNDGDMDILCALSSDNTIAWWENTDGAGAFVWRENIADGTFTGAFSSSAVDFDGDGDMDVIGTALDINEIAWWENEKGQYGLGYFSAANVIDAAFTGARSVYAADIDGDGDMDVLGAAEVANNITWWEMKDTYCVTGTYESRVFDTGVTVPEYGTISWTETVPGACPPDAVKIQVGTLDTPERAIFAKRRPIVITGSTDGDLTDYQVKIDVTHDSDMQDDFDDIRFTTSDGTTELDYYRESYVSGISAVFWVEVDSILASPAETTIYMYYGNSTIDTTTSGDDTFILFDDFAGTSLDTNKWNETVVGSGSVTVSGGEVHMSIPGIYDRADITAVSGPQTGVIVEFSLKTQRINPTSKWGDFFSGDSGALGNNTNIYLWSALYGNDVLVPLEDIGYNRYEFISTGTDALVFVNGVEKANHAGNNWTVIPIFGNPDKETAAGNVYVDWMFERKYAADKPAIGTAGVEEPGTLSESEWTYGGPDGTAGTYFKSHVTVGGGWQEIGVQGPGTDQLDAPGGVFVDTVNNRVYVADKDNNRIVSFDSGEGGTVWGANWDTFIGGPGEDDLSGPRGVYVDTVNNKVYIADTGKHRIACCNSASSTTTFGDPASWDIRGVGTSGSGSNQFNTPTGLYVDTAGDKVYVADMANSRIACFDSKGSGTTWGANWKVHGTNGLGIDQFDNPTDIFVDTVNDKVYVADTGNSRIVYFDSVTADESFTGVNWKVYGSSGTGDDQFNGPTGVFVDTVRNKVYAVDNGNSRVTCFDSETTDTVLGGNWQTPFGTNGSGDSQFNLPFGIFVETIDAKVYAADAGNHRIARFNFTSKWDIDVSLDGLRYVRYKVTLQTADTEYTPELDNIRISFASDVAGDSAVSGVSEDNFTIEVASIIVADIIPETVVAGITGNYEVTFTSINPVAIGGKVVVTFPAAFDITLADYVSGNSGATVAAIGQNAEITLGAAITADEAVSITLSGIKNPDNIGAAGAYSLKTTTWKDKTIDSISSIAGDNMTVGGALTLADVEPATRYAGVSENMTIMFTTVNPIPADGKIVVTLREPVPAPAGGQFVIDSGGTTAATSAMSGTLTVSEAGGIVTITRNDDGTQEDTGSQTITLTYIANPAPGGTTGTYELKTTTSTGTVIDEDAAVEADHIIGELALGSPTVLHETDINGTVHNNLAGAYDDTVITFTTFTAIPTNGSIEMDFPAEYNLTGTLSVNGGGAGVGVSSSGQTLTIDVDGTLVPALGDAEAASITVTGIGNPEQIGTTSGYAIRSKNTSGALIDENTAVPGINIVIPAFEILQPTAGTEYIYVGQTYNITWTGGGTITDDISLYYATDATGDTSSATYSNLISLGEADDGTYEWTVGYDSAFSPANPGDVPSIGVKIQNAYHQEIGETTDAQFGTGTASNTIVSGEGNNAEVKLEDYSLSFSPITITYNSGDITAANDIRIRIPSSFDMTWNTLFTTADITGGAAGKISSAVSYEGSDKVLVLDVTTDFAAGDTIVISGLSFNNFNTISTMDKLELELYNNGITQFIDSKYIEIKSSDFGPFIGGSGDGWDSSESVDMVLQ